MLNFMDYMNRCAEFQGGKDTSNYVSPCNKDCLSLNRQTGAC